MTNRLWGGYGDPVNIHRLVFHRAGAGHFYIQIRSFFRRLMYASYLPVKNVAAALAVTRAVCHMLLRISGCSCSLDLTSILNVLVSCTFEHLADVGPFPLFHGDLRTHPSWHDSLRCTWINENDSSTFIVFRRHLDWSPSSSSAR